MSPVVAGVTVRDYSYPNSARQYYPDAEDPIDKWLQTDASANAATIVRIIQDIHGGVPDVVVDPFCGAGSSGLAARRMGIPFFGIELDPILAGVSLAKATLSPADVLLAQEYLPVQLSHDWLLNQIGALPARVAALALLAIANKRLRNLRSDELLRQLSAGLHGERPPVVSAAINCGDCRLASAWARVPQKSEMVIFTSPPFRSAARSQWDNDPAMRRLRQLVAANVFGATDLYSSSGEWVTVELLSCALAAARQACGRFTAIAELEDASPRMAGVLTAVDALENLPGITVREVLKTRNFAGSATLYQIVAVSEQAVDERIRRELDDA
jgi:hypothetical protein